MTHRVVAFLLAITTSFGLVGCGSTQSGHVSGLMAKHVADTGTAPPQTGFTQQGSWGSPHTLFDKAQGRALTSDADFGQYIDSSVTGSDRDLAIKFMRMMPPTWRGDFIYFDHAHSRLMSNNPALVQYVTVTTGAEAASSATGTQAMSVARTASTRRTQSYQDGCSPPDPYTGTGPYVRFVSKCYFSGAIGFVVLQCGTSQMASSTDSGNMYFEVTNGPSGSRTEGGLTYYTDTWNGGTSPPYTGMAPYYRNSSNGVYTNLNSGGFHYNCGQTITIAHGPVTGSGYTYTFTGYPTNYTPQQFWQGAQIQFNNPAWEFDDNPSSWPTGFAPDPAGFSAACYGCSISEVTSLAQNNGESNDGSTFGASGTTDGVHWQQVGFGQWENGCQQQDYVSYCYLQYSPDYTIYFGGIDVYQGISGLNTVAQYHGPTPSNYGPWETYVGIALPPSAPSTTIRSAAGAFTAGSGAEPFCAADSAGYCYQQTAQGFQSTCEALHVVNGHPVYYAQPYYENTYYAVYSPSLGKLLEVATYHVTKGNLCAVTSSSWTPAEPKVQYSDSNLP